jgi:hypothetical protein
MKLRKQVYNLLPKDLEEFPVWEFALDEEWEENQDEATVRPIETVGPVDPKAGMFIVKAMFTLADGSHAIGYLTPPVKGENSLGTLQPAIVTDKCQVSFWRGINKPSPDQIAKDYALLCKSASSTFPLHFESTVPLVGGVVTGTLPGFLVLENRKSRVAKTVR